MSNSKGIKSAGAKSKPSNGLTTNSSVPKGDSGLNEGSFDNLKDKISAQLRKIEPKAGKNNQKNQKQVQAKGSDSTRGKKRSADGAVIENQKQKSSIKTAVSNSDNSKDSVDQELKAALKELGGTEEDLDLIAGADSESELEGVESQPTIKLDTKKKGSTLQAGIDNILKEIALAQESNQQGFNDSEVEENDNGDADEGLLPEEQISPDQNVALKPMDKPSKEKTSNSRFKCEPRADWYNNSMPDVDLETKPKYRPSQQTIDQLHAHAESLLNSENKAFKGSQQSSSSQAFYNTVIASGTLSDKISALTLAVQESPLHNVKALENLVGLAGKRNRAQAIDVLRAIKDLFAQGSLLPSDRRLFTFATQPALLAVFGKVRSWNQGEKLPHGIQEVDLICWAYEDWLKQQYFEILKILEVWCNDEIEYAKGRAVSYVFELLKEKPEQESNLLRLLVNKIGDPVKKIASQTSYLLMQLLSTHPAMKMIVVSAVEADFIFRPGQSMHGKYYAVVTLNQTALSTNEENVAKKLLGIYFGLFTTLLKSSNQDQDTAVTVNSQSRAQRQRKKKIQSTDNAQAEELREKLISAVLTGVNRAYPYVGTDQKDFTDHLETLFKITHSANFNTSIQAMLLIQQLTTTHSASSDRFYRTLYESLLDPRLIAASKQQMYLNLLHRSLKVDMNTKRIKAFVKRLLQVLTMHDPSFICGVFFLLQDLEKAYPSLTALINQSEDHENDEEVFRDVDEDGIVPDAKAANKETSKNWYDGSKRAPEFANADNSCAWEVLPFLAHFHPSVTVSADHFIQHSKLPGKPDLNLHTLIHFLDRFVYRNAKLASNKLRGASIMQPMASDDTHAVLISSGAHQAVPAVNTDEFRNKKDSDVAADDVFFHKYFTTLGRDVKTKKTRDRDTDDEGSVGDEGEDAVWKAMIDSAPDLEGEDSEGDDIDMSDLEDLEDELASDDELSEDGGVNFGDGADDDEVDIEAGIFDDSDDEIDGLVADEDVEMNSDSDFEGLDSEVEAEDSVDKKQKEKRKAEKEKRKKMKALPTFASAADYAKMLDEDEDEDLG